MSQEESAELSAECALIEAALLPRLQATVPCGLQRGVDKYWEFVLPPANDLRITCDILQVLDTAKLLPAGYFSLHATLSGVGPQAHVYIVLLLLELLFVRKERIERGFRSGRAWAQKGRGGIYQKSSRDLLYDSGTAYEWRTLELPPTRAARENLLAIIAHLAKHLSMAEGTSSTFETVVADVQHMLAQAELPYEVWHNPQYRKEVWRRYLDRFDSMRETAYEITQRLNF